MLRPAFGPIVLTAALATVPASYAGDPVARRIPLATAALLQRRYRDGNHVHIQRALENFGSHRVSGVTEGSSFVLYATGVSICSTKPLPIGRFGEV